MVGGGCGRGAGGCVCSRVVWRLRGRRGACGVFVLVGAPFGWFLFPSFGTPCLIPPPVWWSKGVWAWAILLHVVVG